MKLRRIRNKMLVAFVVGTLLLGSKTAFAALVEGSFSGGGGLVTGTFSYDTSLTSDANPDPGTGVYPFSPAMDLLSVTIGALTWSSGDNSLVLVQNDVASKDIFQIGFADNSGNFPGFVNNGSVLITLEGDTTLLSSDALPTELSQLNLSGSGATATGIIASDNFTFTFDIDLGSFALTDPSPAVPEPGTLLLIGSGLAGIGIGAGRRKRK